MSRFRTSVIGRVAVVAAALAAVLVVPGGGAATATPSGTTAGHANPLAPRVVVARRPALEASTPRFTLRLPSIPPGSTFAPENVLAGFGCTGGNQSPELRWSGVPAGTKSFLVTFFDENAPTGSGFWHWAAWNIPGTATGLPAGAGTAGGTGLPAPGVNGRSDFGFPGYGGPCPPVGERPHRYVFSVVALDTADLQIPPDLPVAAVQVVMRTHALAVATRLVPFGR